MKKSIYLILLLVAFIFVSCSKDEPKLEVFSPEAFAFHLEDEWELNATVQVKGFMQEEEDLEYVTKLSYYANIVTPTGDLLEEVDYGMIDKRHEEELLDLELGFQIIIDSSFVPGDYKLQIFVIDDLSEQQDSASTKFTLSK